MIFENFLQQISAGLLFELKQSASEIGERLRTDVVAKRLFAQCIPHTKIEEIRRLKLLIRQPEQVFDDLQEDLFVDGLVRATEPVVIENVEILLVNLREDVVVEMRGPVVR